MAKYSICTDTSVASWGNQYAIGTLENCKMRGGVKDSISRIMHKPDQSFTDISVRSRLNGSA